MKCRLYATPTGLTGMTAEAWLHQTMAPARPFVALRVDALRDRERALHGRILRAFATWSAPGASQLGAWARELALDASEAAATLARHDLVRRDADTGAVTVAYPFSAAPTRHRVRLSSGREVYAMCDIDALGIEFMLGEPTEVSSTDRNTHARCSRPRPRSPPRYCRCP